MVTQKIVVAEPSGLHLRPAGKLCEMCLEYQSKIQIKKGTNIANAKSVLGILAARVQQGDEIEIICDGADEDEALAALVTVMQEGFGLPAVEE
ncbi:MAG: HPr family phosphocarrier protein [Lachnospiraceae bacterium]|nr:HPr family phosphocarrier protein [Lachnospiraceae bacterium]